MRKPPSASQIDIVARSHEEQERRVAAGGESDTIEIDKLADTVRIEPTPRAETQEREMLRQPWMVD